MSFPLSGSRDKSTRGTLSRPLPGLVEGATVQKDTVTGEIRRIRGEVLVPGSHTPRQAADGFLRAHAALLNLSVHLRELRLVREVASLTATHFTYEQVYAGLPVFGGELSVHVGADLKVRSVNADLAPISRRVVVATPRNPTRAIQAAVAVVNATGGPTKPPVATAGIFVRKGTPVAAWRVTFDTHAPPGAWEVLVAARDGAVLFVRNMARQVNGSALVFNPNPVQSSGNAALIDDDDADSSALNSERTSVTLHNLDGSGMLQGSFCSTAPTDGQIRANEPTNTFNYPRSDDRFEEVMCYHWITESQRYIQSLGFTNVNNRVQGVNVNGITDDNSFYSPATGMLTTGSGEVDDAEDADVILHEYGHAIQDNQVPGWGESQESGAMGEGFGDYWAGSNSAAISGPQSPDWDVFVAKWDAVSYNLGTPAFLRLLNSTKHYPEDLDGDVHDDGEIWSACLWQIRDRVGRTRADTMILEAHFSVSPEGSFEDGANAIVETNQALYGGADGITITQIFRDRGILPPPTRFNIAGRITDGNGVANVQVQATGPAVAEISKSRSPGTAIPDSNLIVDALTISTTEPIIDLSVGVDITHPFIGDLQVTLIHPDGTSVMLYDQTGQDAQNIHTVYPDQMRPAESLAVLTGKPMNGTWKLQVADLSPEDVGTLDRWTLTLRYPSGQTTLSTTTNAQGLYAFTGLLPGEWTVRPQSTTSTFTPPSQVVSVGPDQDGIDFRVAVAAPTNLTATAVSQTAIDLKWRDNSNNESGFRLERKAGSGAYALVASPVAGATSYRDSGRTANTTYTYRVRAYKTGVESPNSNEATVTTLPNPPAAPSALTATAVSQTAIDLKWRDNSNNETGFKLERKTGTGAYAQIATPAANATTYRDATGLTANTAYVYHVRAYNTGGDSAYSSEATATTLPLPPAAPSALTATAVSQTVIDLKWRNHSTNETGFRLERKTGSGVYALVASPAAGATGYRDSGRTANTAYTYRVRAYNTGGESPNSNEATVTTLPNPPAAPSALTGTAVSQTAIDLKWRDNSNSEDGFQVERRIGGGSYAQIAAPAANTTAYSNTTGLVANTPYTYRVRAYNTGGPSAYSNEVTVTTLPLPPAAPSTLTATLVSDTAIDLKWRDNSGNETGFRLERKVGAAAFALLVSPTAGVVSYRDSRLAPNTLYTYRVRAYNAGGESGNSNEASATTPRYLGGTLEVSPTRVNFGKVKVKKTKRATVTLRNASATEQLRVTVTAPAAPFKLPSLPGTVELGPGATVAVSVSFRPTKKKKYSGRLGLASSDSAHAAISVGLKGAGK